AMAGVPLLPSLVAVMVAQLAATPAMRPAEVTVAIRVFELGQVIVRPAKVFPALSLATAVGCRAPPIWTLADAGLTVTDATGSQGGYDAPAASGATAQLLIVTATPAEVVTCPAASRATAVRV